MENPKNSKNAEYELRLNTLRGEILQYQINCEQLLTQILVFYYGGESARKRKLIFNDFISELSFYRKIQLVCKILVDYKWESEKIKEIRKDLNYIREVRNNLAHDQWVFMDDQTIVFNNRNKEFSYNEKFKTSYKTILQRITIPLHRFFMKELSPYMTFTKNNDS